MAKKTQMTFHDFYCTNCGRLTYTLPRKVCHQHNKGHLKNLYCPWCKQEYNHWECHDDEEAENFKINFKMELINHELLNYVLRDSWIGKIHRGNSTEATDE